MLPLIDHRHIQPERRDQHRPQRLDEPIPVRSRIVTCTRNLDRAEILLTVNGRQIRQADALSYHVSPPLGSGQVFQPQGGSAVGKGKACGN